MQVAISANTSWYVYNLRLSLINRLLQRGIGVAVVAPWDEYSQRLQSHGCVFRPIVIDNKGYNPVAEFKAIFDYYRLYKALQPDLVLQYTPKANIYGSFAAKMAGIPSINNIAGLGVAFGRKSMLSYIVRLLYRFSQKGSHKVFFQNPEDMQLFLQKGLVAREKAILIPGSGVDPDYFAPSQGAKQGEFSFILVSRLIWDKGVGEYVQAARMIKAKHPQVEFQLLGFSDQNNPKAVSPSQIKAWEEEGIVRYLGRTDDVRPYIAGADCVVLPSYYREGVPRSLLEAASMAKPLITTDSIGCRQVVEDRMNGFLCRPRDPFDLAVKMENMLALDAEERTKMGERGREKMLREFDERQVLDRYMQEVEAVLTKHRMQMSDNG